MSCKSVCNPLRVIEWLEVEPACKLLVSVSWPQIHHIDICLVPQSLLKRLVRVPLRLLLRVLQSVKVKLHRYSLTSRLSSAVDM